MISKADLMERVREWGLRVSVVEKGYVIGWVFWGIGSDNRLSEGWAFKGGTCLKKCYIETYRFSENLDFTVLLGGLRRRCSCRWRCHRTWPKGPLGCRVPVLAPLQRRDHRYDTG